MHVSVLAAVESILKDADTPLALSHAQHDGPRQMLWASQPLLGLLGSAVPDCVAELALFNTADRSTLEGLYRADGADLSSAILAARGQDGSLCHDRVTVQRFESGTSRYWTTHHDITPALKAAPRAEDSIPDVASSPTDELDKLLLVSQLSSRSAQADRAVEELALLFVPSMATWTTIGVCSVDLDGWRYGTSLHEKGSFPPVYDHEVRAIAPRAMGSSDHVEVLLGRRSFSFVPHVTRNYLTSNYPPEAAAVMAELGLASLIVVPLLVGADITGLLVLARTADRPPFAEADLELARLIGQRAGQHLRRLEEAWDRRKHSMRLQRALLPDITPHPGIEARTVYRPSAVHANVGGDWFDVHPLGRDRVILAIGDVCGHDVEAAATMAHYRATIRTFLWQGESPARAISLLDELLSMNDDFPAIATALVAVVDRSDPDGFHLTYSTAGHPPGFLLLPEGEVLALDRARATPIGVPPPCGSRPLDRLNLPYGSTIVLYTDGVVEQRSTPLRERIDSVGRILRSLPQGSSVAEIQDALLDLNDPYRLEDDMCIVVARVTESAASGNNPR